MEGFGGVKKSRVPGIAGGHRNAAARIRAHIGTMAWRRSFGRRASQKAFSRSHSTVFQEWLSLPLVEKTHDLLEYLNGSDDLSTVVLKHWKDAETFRRCMPDTARTAERKLFVPEFEV
jgi:hypothetical protein